MHMKHAVRQPTVLHLPQAHVVCQSALARRQQSTNSLPHVQKPTGLCLQHEQDGSRERSSG